MKMVCDWKLELMAKEVLGACWQNRKEDAMEAFRLIKQYAVADKKIGNTELSSINSDIDKLNNRLEKMIEMRADGELTKEEYAKSKARIEAELADLNKRKAGLDNSDDSSEFHLDLEKIEHELDRLTDLEKLDSDIVDSFISRITPVDNNRFEWIIRLSENTSAAAVCCVGGRKNKATATIEGVSPLTYTYDFCIIDLRELKKTCRSGGQDRLLLSRSSHSQIALTWDFTVTYDMAKAWRKAHGAYLRQGQWQDLTMRICIDVG